MKIKSAIFDVSAPDLRLCPKWAFPEFAFIGRSNVGKSSLINMLAGVNGLAKVSDTPGKTKLINFFIINDAWSLVDLPGYGYAKVAKTDRNKFNDAVAEYIQERRNIFCIFVLIDSRLPPQQIDLEFVNWLIGCSAPFVLVFTKSDKQTSGRSQENIGMFKKSIADWSDEAPLIFTTSAKTNHGRSEVLAFIQSVLTDHNRK